MKPHLAFPIVVGGFTATALLVAVAVRSCSKAETNAAALRKACQDAGGVIVRTNKEAVWEVETEACVKVQRFKVEASPAHE